MKANETLAQRLGRILEKVTRQSGRLPDSTPAYGSWLLGRVAETQRRRRIRIQVLLTVLIMFANLVGIGVATLLITVALPEPDVFGPSVRWITAIVAPAYIVVAIAAGTYWVTFRTVNALRWAIEDRPPTREAQRSTIAAPFRLAMADLTLWTLGAALLTVLYGLDDPEFIPKIGFSVGFCGIVVSTAAYLFTEFALRPVAAQALAAGPAPRRLAPGVMGRIMNTWLLASGVPLFGIILAAVFALTLHNLTITQFGVTVLLIGGFAFVVGVLLMWIAAWITATPVRVVRAAMRRVEDGDLDGSLVVFDGTELGELQRGFNSMVAGLREREKVRDLFGRHVGREVAAAAEARRFRLGGEERHAAVIFVDIIGSTQLITGRPATEVVALLNRFFAVVVEEVDNHDGLVNKFEGDACLAVFGAPNDLENPESAALAAARAIADRLTVEVPECQAGIGVAAGTVVAGNVGAHERFEYTVIGEPVNEAARLCELAKSTPRRLLASSDAIRGATETERAHWVLGDLVTLRGHDVPTRLASPI
ncbi:MAG: adenylate/guanylate cyclase domain-containing protein [Mycobacterium sp.]|nr:adenylate/guanylate cyclase domain-containing protein [Mycobacterium sp.]